jgi:hypothetical protein
VPIRDGHRVIVDSPELVSWLFAVLRPHLPQHMGSMQLVGLNERLRFLCYTPGQVFEEHCDGCYTRPSGHPQEGDVSMVTVQVYLHDIPVVHGGATTFFPGRHNEVAHQPEMGSILMFTQDLLHEGSLLRAGLKYTLRTEAMYRADAAAGDVADLASPLTELLPNQPSTRSARAALHLSRRRLGAHLQRF